ncbi:MAG: hypothetical protein WBB23_13670 [Desulforhopalus sp.]
MTNLLTLLENLEMQPRRASVAHGGEYHSACPACGDGGKGKKSDRFHIWPDKPNGGIGVGRFWCRQCGVSGDTIEFLVRFENMTFPAACAELGIVLEGNQSSGVRRPVTPRIPSKPGFSQQPREYDLPAGIWSKKAAAFLDDCHRRLLDRPDALQWLADRGINIEAVIRYRLGYNESSKGKDRYRPRRLWGLPEEKNSKGRPARLWLPRGWVIPLIAADGAVIQLRIRRLDEDIAAFMDNIKYLMIKGSCPGTMVLHPDAEAHAVVESGFDAILIASNFDGLIGVVTTWNSSAKPDARSTTILHRSQCILNCLDFDDAGRNEQTWWSETFRRNKRWPPPVGKDPGEAFEAGVDIRRWILEGLPVGLAWRVAGFKEPGQVTTSPSHEEPVLAQDTPECIEESGDEGTEDMPAIAGDGSGLQGIKNLRWCAICHGDRFLALRDGGFLCVECQPSGKPGRLVLATVPRGNYAVS